MFKIYWQGGFLRRIRLNPLQLISLGFLGFGLLFIAISGIIFLGSGFFQMQKYVQGQCVITEKHMVNETNIEKDSNGNQRTVFLYRPSFTYQVHAADGRVYSAGRYEYSEYSSSDQWAQQAILDHFQVNSTYSCWYNPENPTEAVLKRSVGIGDWIGMGIFLGVGLIFALLGIVALFTVARTASRSPDQQEQFFAVDSRSSQSGSVLPSFGSIFENVTDDALRSQLIDNDQLSMLATGISPTEREDMMSEIDQFVEQYMAMWHETDAGVRRKYIAELFVEDGVQFLPEREYRGYEALEERVSGAHEEFVAQGGFVFRPAGDVKGHHNSILFSWEMVPASGGEVATTGTIFLLLSDDGRIELDYQF
jgi:hypothetical protein